MELVSSKVRVFPRERTDLSPMENLSEGKADPEHQLGDGLESQSTERQAVGFTHAWYQQSI